MYHLSRRLYRELAPAISEPGQHARVLAACEGTVERLVDDPRRFARPASKLFAEIRWCFGLRAQARVRATVDRHVGALHERLLSDNELLYELTGVRPACEATTRKGTACTHEPDPRTGYCAWHRHLADDALQLSA